MKPRIKIYVLDVVVIVLFAGWLASKLIGGSGGEKTSGFEQQIDLRPLYATAVQNNGRIRSFESHAHVFMQGVSGPRLINGQSRGFTYLDLMFRPEAYTETPIIYVKNKLVRNRLIEKMIDANVTNKRGGEALQESGLFARPMITQPQILELVDQMRLDMIRTAKPIRALESAFQLADPGTLEGILQMIPIPGSTEDDPWESISTAIAGMQLPADSVHAGLAPPQPNPTGSAAHRQQVGEAWIALRAGWRAQDAASVNTSVAKLAAFLPTIAPDLYPAQRRLAMESWYFRYKSMTWVWLFYLVAVIPLLMAVIYKWERAGTVGTSLFVVAFAAHTASIVLRWYISGRWPNSNMFEAVTTSAWFGGVLALSIEWFARRSLLRNVFALGSAVASMVALMAAHFLPADLDSTIQNKMAALNDVWLYIHTNVIIASYALIFLAAVTALLLLRHRWCLAWDNGTIPRFRLLVVPVAMVSWNVAVYLLMMHFVSPVGHELTTVALVALSALGLFSSLILIQEMIEAKTRYATGVRMERSASGGASALIGTGANPNRPSFVKSESPSMSQVLDGATMVLVELSLILLWTGLVMGAIWADHSWGRPWGWDPKEVFALNTFFILAALIHVRIKVRDKGFWTAIIAVLGCEVMLFNWIVINFIVTGLHSYA